jgi:hypothetical protein
MVFASGDMAWAHPYCETIARVTTSAKSKRHSYCCGEGSDANREYFNRDCDRAVCLNLIYVVKDPKGYQIKFPVGSPPVEEKRTYPQGAVWGAQWELTLRDDDDTPKLKSTDLPVLVGPVP